MDIKEGQAIAGFTVTQVSDVVEACGTAYVMEHPASDAKLVCLKNDDPELSFSISFSTPAADDSGVFHILEHSMLCGSERYPLKEPFTAMLKTSMQTYLNAFTGPDYTMYPVASANAKDLVNLMDVYMDAVLNPLFLHDESVFRQEGWHLECDGSADSLAVNGVVYNEMKGAKSAPVRCAVDAVRHALFGQGTYGFESGGDPASITKLGFEQFVDSYRRHYRLDNAIITLYGDIDIAAVLQHLQDKHIAPWLAAHADQGAFGQPNKLELAQPRLEMDVTQVFKGGPESAMLAFGSVLSGPLDVFRTTAAGIVCDALFGSVEAPVRKLLLDSGICGDVVACNMSGSCQPYALVVALGASQDDRKRFVELLTQGCNEVIASGELPKLVDATVSMLEFAWRQGPKEPCGIAFAQEVRSCWPYGLDPLASMRYEDFLSWHALALENGTYERMAKELFAEYNHAACVAIIPDMELDAFGEHAFIQNLAQTVDAQGVDKIAQETRELNQMRLAADDPAALACLLRLDRADLAAAATRPKTSIQECRGTRFMRVLEPTHGIDYVDYYFDLSGMSLEDVQYLSLLCSLAGELAAGDMDAAQVQVQMKRCLGEADCDVVCVSRWQDGQPLVALKLSFSALGSKRKAAHEFFWTLFAKTDFEDATKVKQIIDLAVLGFEQTASSRATNLAALACFASNLKTSAVNDAVEGIGSYRFLKELSVLEDIAPVIKRLKKLRDWLMSTRPSLVCFAGDDAGYDLARVSSPCFEAADDARAIGPFTVELHAKAKTGYALPTNVAANATYLKAPAPRHLCGLDSLLGQALNWDYLWNHVRVKGGAYGASCVFGACGDLNLVSLRDPRIDATVDDFSKAADWLAAHEFSQDEVDGLVISAIANADKPRKVPSKMEREVKALINGRPLEDRDKARADILAATPQALHEHALALAQYVPAGSVASIASREMLEASRIIDETCDLLV